MSEMNPYSKLQIHVRDIARVRSIRFAFYRFLHIIDRRIQLPHMVFLGKGFNSDESFLEKFLNPSRNLVVLDIGANVGFWTLKFAKRYRKIHAFEPNPEIFPVLKKTIRKLRNVSLHRCALGDESGFSDFFVHRGHVYSGLLIKREGYIKTIRVPVRTLDSFGFDAVGLIKIDTEGFELPILMGGIETIKRETPQLYIEIHEQDQEAPILNLLQELGYTYSIFPIRNGSQSIIITARTPLSKADSDNIIELEENLVLDSTMETPTQHT